MCHELYDTLMQRNEWYANWKAMHPEGTTPKALEASFVRRTEAHMLPGARAVLAQMLRTGSDPTLSDTIAEALLLDATLVRGDRRGMTPAH
jgi:hypothetical protein